MVVLTQSRVLTHNERVDRHGKLPKLIFVRHITITRVHGRIKTVTFSPGPLDGGYPTEFHAYDGFYLIGEFLRGPHPDFTSDYTMYSGRDNAGHIIQTDSETPYTVTRDDYVPPARWRYHFTVTKNGTTILTAEVTPSERLGPQLILHIAETLHPDPAARGVCPTVLRLEL
jgi:hypothetical protein